MAVTGTAPIDTLEVVTQRMDFYTLTRKQCHDLCLEETFRITSNEKW